MISNSLEPGVFLEDLETITNSSVDDLTTLVNRNVLLTGSTGFVGTWLAASYLHARETLGGTGRLICVARSFNALDRHRSMIHAHPNVTLISSDVRSLEIPSELNVDIIIHAATPASATLNANNPMEMISTIIDGQRRILDQAVGAGVRRVVFMSSGAVYGPQPMDLERLPVDWKGGPQFTDPVNAYHEAKRLAELMGHVVANEGKVEFVTARLFAFLAPFLPLNQHFAAGNFLRDALEGRFPKVTGNPRTMRSYQYGTDMSSWIWAIAARAANRSALNVGSDEKCSIGELAELIAEIAQLNHISERETSSSDVSATNYVPDVSLTVNNLSVRNIHTLRSAIARTLRWHSEDRYV